MLQYCTLTALVHTAWVTYTAKAGPVSREPYSVSKSGWESNCGRMLGLAYPMLPLPHAFYASITSQPMAYWPRVTGFRIRAEPRLYIEDDCLSEGYRWMSTRGRSPQGLSVIIISQVQSRRWMS